MYYMASVYSLFLYNTGRYDDCLYYVCSPHSEHSSLPRPTVTPFKESQVLDEWLRLAHGPPTRISNSAALVMKNFSHRGILKGHTKRLCLNPLLVWMFSFSCCRESVNRCCRKSELLEVTYKKNPDVRNFNLYFAWKRWILTGIVFCWFLSGDLETYSALILDESAVLVWTCNL